MNSARPRQPLLVLAAVFATAVLAASCHPTQVDGPAPDEGSSPAGEVVVPAEPAAGSAAAEGAPSAAPTVARLIIDPSAVRIGLDSPPTQLVARAFAADGTELFPTVQWHSLDPTRVMVTSEGVLRPLGPIGPAFITASAGGTIADQVAVYVAETAALAPEPEGSAEEPDTGVRVRRIISPVANPEGAPAGGVGAGTGGSDGGAIPPGFVPPQHP